MRLTNVFGLLISIAVPLCFGQATNQITVNGYPALHNVPISIQEAVQLALEHNLDLQFDRYNPAIIGYDIQSLYGTYYDPKFNASWQRSDSTVEGLPFSQGTGLAVPPSVSQVDSTAGNITGILPTGMRYTLFSDLAETRRQNVGIDYWSSDAGISVSQPLLRNFWTDSSRTGIRLRKQDKKIADLTVEQRAQTIVAQVIAAYYKLVGALEGIKVAESDLKVKSQFYNETKRRVEVGDKAPLDETKAGAAVAVARKDLVTAQGKAGDADAELKGLLADDYASQIGAIMAPTDKLLLTPVLIDFQTSVGTALKKRPEIIREREALESQNIQLKYQFNQLFPILDVFATWQANGTDSHLMGSLEDIPQKDFQRDLYGARLTVPLSFWAERHAYRKVKLSKQQQIVSLQRQQAVVVKEVDDAIRTVSTAYTTAKLSRESVIAAEADLDAQQKRFAVGKGTSLDVLDAASNLTKARNDEIQAIVDYNVALNELTRAEGTALEERRIDFETAHRTRSIRVE